MVARRSAIVLTGLLGLAGGCGQTGAQPPRSSAATKPAATAKAVSTDARTPRAAGTGSRLLVALERANRVAILTSTPRWRVLRRVRVPAGPHNLTASRALGVAAVTSPPAGRVTILDASGRVVASASVPGYPHDAVFAPSRLWVAAENGRRLVALGPRSGRTITAVRTSGPPHDLAVSPDGRRLWVTIDGSDAVEIRDARSGRLLKRAVLGGAPHDLAFAPGGKRVWLSNVRSGRLTVATAAGRPIGGLTAGTEPHHFAFGLGRLWASDNGGGSLVRIAPGSRRVLGRTPVGATPHHVVVAQDQVLVAVNGTGRLAVVRRSGRVAYKVPLGAGPHDLDLLPAP